MASSNVEICNGALGLIGDDPITSLTEGSKRANLCNSFYPLSLDAVLRLHPWNFAVKRVSLAPKTQAPAYGYSAAFAMPSDLVRLLEVTDITDYKVEGRDIVADESQLDIRYIARIADVTLYDALFVETLQAYMAWKMAYPLTKSNTTAQAMFTTFKALLPWARNIDAQEEPQDTLGDFPLINARLGGR